MLRNLSVTFYVASAVLVVTGFIVMFTYGDYDPDDIFNDGSTFGHVVGGDAYNYIIIGVRGLGFIMTGVISSIIASSLLIYSKINVNFKVEQVES
ncbi:hypothetical protein [Paenibacillus sp. HB172176]|uniref:hypothetical protein n=1 Tax=Paenibacillus sp. HB172176 TaxID=2493690 RepID=UPI001439C49B|nr:hypothetical protein [Paenibacillus sp. HB172176]